MTRTVTYREALRESIHTALKDNPQVVIMGQGVSDPTRIFGTTKNLVEEFGPERVIDTPISEESVSGIAVGTALNGLYPITTHIRVDFMMLAMNQIVNMIAKYQYSYGGSFALPMLIRGVIGRSWGQGPQHSQSLQALFSHIPGLTVIMPSSAADVLSSYSYAINKFNSPVISLEHRLLYDMNFHVENDLGRPPFTARIVQAGDNVTIAAASYMVEEARQAAEWVSSKEGIRCEIIDLHVVSDIDHKLIHKSVLKTGRLIVADTGWVPYGVCAEVCRGLVEIDPTVLKKPVIQLGMAHTPCPTSHALEEEFYPDMKNLVDAIYTLHFGTSNHKKELPSGEYARSQRREFKGPF